MRILSTADLDSLRTAGETRLFPERIRINVGTATCGLAAGSGDVYHALEQRVEQRRLDAILSRTGCIGYCQQEPLVDVRLPGAGRVVYIQMTRPRVRALVDALVEPPHDDPKYHLTEDMVDKALTWLDNRQSYAPDKPFLMYWAPGAAHGPHHVFPEWADKYKGKFDDGWDAYRERVFKRQLEMGIIPPGTKLTPRDESMQAWADIPENQRAFQRRGMELFAGFVEHTDDQVGRLVDGLERRGLRENTLIFYILGDNGSSAEGQQGSISELLAQNNIANTVDQQLATL